MIRTMIRNIGEPILKCRTHVGNRSTVRSMSSNRDVRSATT